MPNTKTPQKTLEIIISEETPQENLKTVVEELKSGVNMKKNSSETKSRETAQANTDDEIISEQKEAKITLKKKNKKIRKQVKSSNFTVEVP